MAEREWVENVVAIAVVAAVGVAVLGLFLGWYSDPETTDDQTYDVRINDDPMLGDPDANVTIIEFSDYECPACRQFELLVMPGLKEKYIDTGIARFVYRDYPLDQIHPTARLAAEAANCAGEQGAYWAYHDALYAREGSLHLGLLNEIARDLALDETRFTACVQTRKYQAEVQGDLVDAINDGGVTATPTFFINGKKLVGAQPLEAFTQLIEAARTPTG